ncbi:MAG: nitroreductase [Bacteroidetes bacterium]|nr:nitroreductase [Bacteroidota bacterium]
MKYNLSELREIIRNRRTIKPEDYSARKVHKEIVVEILNNALWAPTHGMTQPWHFKVFTDEGISRLADFLANTYKANTSTEHFLQKKFEQLGSRPRLATVAIAVCMKRQDIEKIAEIEEIEAVACAVQNMHLTATAYGLGGYWSSPEVIYSEDMKTFLNLGKNDRCLGVFYLGYPKTDWPASHRRPLEYQSEWIEK